MTDKIINTFQQRRQLEQAITDFAQTQTEAELASATQLHVETLHLRLGHLDRAQITTWRRMSPARRLNIAFQAYQFALNVVRVTERQKHPTLSPDELAWRITRRMQGNPKLGK